jgi:magnesium chelatase family protein
MLPLPTRACQVDLYPSGTARDFVTVGMPDTAVRESRERIKSALLNSGFSFPYNKGITINLAPANVRKEGAGFDLPMAHHREPSLGRSAHAVRRSLPDLVPATPAAG